MMRTTTLRALILSTWAAVPSLAMAQSVPFSLNPDVTAFASRGSLGTSAGEICTGFGPSIVRGLGESPLGNHVRGLLFVVQDSNGATPETYHVVLRGGTEASGPGTGPASVLFDSGGIATPPSGSGPVAWQITLSFASDVAVPTDGYFTAGVAVTAIGGGSDSLYLHVGISGSAGEHPSTPDVTWQINSTTAVSSHPNNHQLPRLRLLLPGSSLQVGNIPGTGTQPLFGIGGSYPDTTAAGPSTQGIAFAVNHPLGGVAQAFVFASLALDPQPSLLPGFAGRVQLDAANLVRAALATGLANGSAIPYIAPGIGALPVGLNAEVVIQALVVDPVTSTFEFTNAQIVHML
ncbi:MAG: hypothetical protein U1F36_00385 [Planctomycetota bacterium]